MGDTTNAIIGCCCIGVLILLIGGMLSPDNTSSDVNLQSSNNPSESYYMQNTTSRYSNETLSEVEGDNITVTIKDIYLDNQQQTSQGSNYAILVPENKTYNIGLSKNDYEMLIRYKGENPIGKTIKIRLGRLNKSSDPQRFEYCSFYDTNGNLLF